MSGSGFEVQVWFLGFEVFGGVEDLGLRVYGVSLGFWGQGSGFGDWSPGIKI